MAHVAATPPATSALPPVDLTVAHQPEVARALAMVGQRLREAAYTGAPVAGASAPGAASVSFARGEPVDRAGVVGALGAGHLDALEAAGIVVPAPGDPAHPGDPGDPVHQRVRLRGLVFPLRSTMVLVPEADTDEHTVYLGIDSVLVLREVWSRCGRGARAVDLGTGTGFLAAALATRFDHVVATDLSARCTATVHALTAMNPHLAGRLSAVQADIGAGLRPASFDVVAANAPWVPEQHVAGSDAPRLFAAGGPTGFELPRRFLDDAASLLVPGGRAFVACADVTFADGRRPLHEHVPRLEAAGLHVEIVPTSLGKGVDLDDWVASHAEGALACDHVVVVVHKPA